MSVHRHGHAVTSVQRVIRHPISPATALALAGDAERYGDATSAAEWFALAEEMDTAEREQRRQKEAAARELAREQLHRHVRRYGM